MSLDLFVRVRERIVEGTLWAIDRRQCSREFRQGEPCAVCDEPITSGESEYEVAGPVMSVRVHVACYHAWNAESQRCA